MTLSQTYAPMITYADPVTPEEDEPEPSSDTCVASCVADTIDSPRILITEEISNTLSTSNEKDNVSQGNALKGKDQDFSQQPHSKNRGNRRKLVNEKRRNRVPTPGPLPKHDSDDEQAAHECESELELEFIQSCQDRMPNQISLAHRMLKSMSDHKFKFKLPSQKAGKDGNSPVISKKMISFKRKKQSSEASSITGQQEDIGAFSDDESTKLAEEIKEDTIDADDKANEGEQKPAKVEEGQANGTDTHDGKKDEKDEKYREGKRWVDEEFFSTNGGDLGFRIWHD